MPSTRTITVGDLTLYIQLIQYAVKIGIDIADQIRRWLPEGHGLTEDQINALEQVSADDDARRLAERLLMGTPSDN